jgi:hypothetical protein
VKFWFGQCGWGWYLYGVSYRDEWFVGLSVAVKMCRHDNVAGRCEFCKRGQP